MYVYVLSLDCSSLHFKLISFFIILQYQYLFDDEFKLISDTKYGSEGIVSTKGDVYSFGILLMETFTKKKPTDEMFVEEMSLKCWVKESLPSKVVHVVDANLLNTGVRERLGARDCVLSILQLALECSTELPEDRIDMEEVVARLKKIKIMFLKEVEQV